MLNLHEKTILITGASSGIGKAISLELAKYKCNLILVGRNIESLKMITDEANKSFCKATYITCDVKKKSDIEKVFEIIKKDYKNVDLAILSAGIGTIFDVNNFSTKDLEDTFYTNFFSISFFVEYLLPIMIKQNSGHIVGISSLSDRRGIPTVEGYNSSKAALTTFLESLRLDLSSKGIKVVTVKPGFVRTPMTEKNKKMIFLLEPEKAAKIIIKGIRKNKKMIKFPFMMSFLMNIFNHMPIFLYDKIIGRLGNK